MSAANWVSIAYREFYDVPRCVVVRLGDRFYYLKSDFLEQLDDYDRDFSVFLLSPDAENRVASPDWTSLEDGSVLLGRIPVDSVRFDESRRRYIDASALERFMG